MLVLFLAIQLLGASTTLHRWFHADSGSASHQCVITLVSQGQIHHAIGEAILPPPQYLFATITPPKVSVWAAVDYRLHPERDPPSLLT